MGRARYTDTPSVAILMLLTGIGFSGILAAVVVHFRAELRTEMRQTLINRAASVLLPVAQRQLAERSTRGGSSSDLLAAVLESARQEDMLAVAIFDAEGHLLQFAPASLLFPELSIEDFIRLQRMDPISRFYPDMSLGRYFTGFGKLPTGPTPVLEVLLPLHGPQSSRAIGFAQYLIAGDSLATQLDLIDRRINLQSAVIFSLSVLLVGAVVAIGYLGLRRAERVIIERNERLARANVELSLAAKTSALGQITAHLLHGLQGPVASLKGMVMDRTSTTDASEDWNAVDKYADRMQEIIRESVALLAQSDCQDTFDLTGAELTAIVRQRSELIVRDRAVALAIEGEFAWEIDGQRGGLVCLIVSNLVQNAARATPAGGAVRIAFSTEGQTAIVAVADSGAGISEQIQAHLFEPGRSGQPGGTGLGLAISQLLARQIGATLGLVSTGPHGTIFRLEIPGNWAGAAR